MNTSTETFNVVELYLLSGAFDGNALFGLPEKEIYQLKGEAIFKEANERLKEKGILTPEGKLTDGGAHVIQALEHYYQSAKYVRINNLMFAFREKDADEVILLVEVEEKETYQLYVVSKAIALRLLGERFPLVLREPDEKEKTFLKEELSNRERREIDSFEPEEMFMNIEFFHLEEKEKSISNSRYYQQWFVFTKDEKLMMVDVVNKKYYHASQYWFLKMLFDEMDFPYKEVQLNG
ncbi:DUF5081 family protein [Sporosarcina pasteurii]|uniref:DUF5081 domain-containing protein n=1 Tax=Sporosarcina pasteurii TaxID=1474 RepID=A0A380BD49_SPOPA|nr:DUF5081 family protein [Sporosarcina pasteurii]MDS9473271.1 DUF5081 family protein [Sporosarcina pasteurii]QBQ06503.1 DUF5081 family protein [Sporosarcina pasteurii]SUI98308.1 Uncharacterised protein [Sporosarcina pasteurii]